jgi:hypothetical protein
VGGYSEKLTLTPFLTDICPPPRLVAFGRFAGIAGMIDILQGVGQNLLAQGYSTPFLNSPSTYMSVTR